MFVGAKKRHHRPESQIRSAHAPGKFLGKPKTVEDKPALLLVDADMRTAMLCNELAKKIGCGLRAASDRLSILTALDQNGIAVVLIGCDALAAALDLLREIKIKSPRVVVLVVEKSPTIQSAVEAMKAGAADYLEKPLSLTSLERSLLIALASYRDFQAVVLPLAEVEKRAIRDAIRQADGDKMRAAQLLDIGKTTLYRKLRQYGESTQRRSRRQNPPE
jgi:DNA-binding NtrC family response regulator